MYHAGLGDGLDGMGDGLDGSCGPNCDCEGCAPGLNGFWSDLFDTGRQVITNLTAPKTSTTYTPPYTPPYYPAQSSPYYPEPEPAPAPSAMNWLPLALVGGAALFLLRR